MKQEMMRDGETTHHQAIGASDKLLRDQELQHLVTSSIPSPPIQYANLSLLNTGQGITVLDPIYSAHLLATIAASNPGARFQLPIPIPISLPVATPRMFDYSGSIPVMTSANLPNAQLDILSSWVNEQQAAAAAAAAKCNKERNMSGGRNVSSLEPRMTNLGLNNNNHVSSNNNNNHNRKRGTNNFSVSKANKKNKGGGVALISSENGVVPMMRKEVDDNKIDMNINMKQTIIPIDKTSNKVSGQKKFDGEDVQAVNNNNNNNSKGSIQHQQQSNQLSNNRDKVFTCPICSRCFGYKHVLQNHERTHTGEKPYFCKICEKRFTRDHHLKTHMRLHTGEKPYNCTHCDKQFVQVANLRRHLRVHTGERPYCCELCDSRFSDSNQLKAHMLIHKGEKPYYCEVCTMRFRRRHHLTQHKCSQVKTTEEEPAFPLSPPDLSPPASNSSGSGNGKRERKSRETRRIIRVDGLPVATVTSSGLDMDPFITMPEQTVPEDLSVGTGIGGLRSRNFSGSGSQSSGVSASPSPSGSRGSLGLYCHSVSSNEHTEYFSDEDKSGTTADSSLSLGKNDSDEHPSPSQG